MTAGSPKPDKTTSAPSLRKDRATARPIPEVDPVISARFPLRNIIDSGGWF
jgi:hypothetical protein